MMTMEKAYIILAHKCPDQLARLIARLNDGNSSFYIHIDRKADLPAFSLLPENERIIKIKRIRTRWAGYSLVQATLNALKQIRDSGRPVERVILLSGQDYPIKNNRYIDAYLETSPYKVFLEHTAIPDHKRWTPRGGLYRLDKYYMGSKGHQYLTAKALNFLSLFLVSLQRRLPGDLTAYAGSQWWILDTRAVEYILKYVRDNPGYSRFHRYTFAPDELFFHMILLNANDERLSESIRNDDLRFMIWKDTNNAHPDILKKTDLPKILDSDALFARKFDPESDPEILNLIDRFCL
jgi:hypothetical protein